MGMILVFLHQESWKWFDNAYLQVDDRSATSTSNANTRYAEGSPATILKNLVNI